MTFSTNLLTTVATAFLVRCVEGIHATPDRCTELIEQLDPARMIGGELRLSTRIRL
jgi:hypothetical protein